MTTDCILQNQILQVERGILETPQLFLLLLIQWCQEIQYDFLEEEAALHQQVALQPENHHILVVNAKPKKRVLLRLSLAASGSICVLKKLMTDLSSDTGNQTRWSHGNLLQP